MYRMLEFKNCSNSPIFSRGFQDREQAIQEMRRYAQVVSSEKPIKIGNDGLYLPRVGIGLMVCDQERIDKYNDQNSR